MTTTINHSDITVIPFDLNDPEVQELAAEMRVQRYLRDRRQFVEIELPEVSDEN